jgi:molybdenum cofactor guanylyltransferase
MSLDKANITAVILAGGQGRRMGGQDKGLIEFDGQRIIEILIQCLQTRQVGILINANRNHPVYQAYGYPVIGDELEDYQGPLAGFAAAMATVSTDYILTLPCDSPMLADDFVDRFIEAQQYSNARVCVAHDGERLQPVYALIATSLLDDLKQFLESGERKIDRWYALHDYVPVDFSDEAAMFQNINTPEDQHRMQQASHK